MLILPPVSLAGAIEILLRAKSVPLYLDAKISHRWDDDRFNAFRTEFRARVPYICHLRITANHLNLHETLEGLVSPAPTLESLVVFSHGGFYDGELGFVLPDTLFSGSTPRLSCLKLFCCEISWTSPLLKGLRHLEIHVFLSRAKPTLEAWLDALDELPHLKTLVLRSASPIASSFPFDVNRTATLPSISHLEILASPGDCALALAHLDLPALTELHIIPKLSYSHPDSDDVPRILPYIVRHAHGPQDTQPLQSVLIRSNGRRVDILAWSVPNIDVETQDPPTFLAETLPPRVALSFTYLNGSPLRNPIELLDTAIAALPLDGLVTLVVQDFVINEAFYFRHVPRWSLLCHVRLAAPSDHGFKQMLMRDDGGQENPLLPSLKELVLVGTLSNNWTLALTNRVSKRGPLELLDLRMCVPHSHEHHMLLGVLAYKFLAPELLSEAREQMTSVWETVARGILLEEANWEIESDYSYPTDDDLDDDHREDGLDIGFDKDEGGVDDEQDGEDEEVEDEWEMEED